ncbi:MAG TPA: PorV/PorQ family protein [Rhodothermales bacterium]|nr:PorV/PorQ family protein [Rhodothermales bacterium]
MQTNRPPSRGSAARRAALRRAPLALAALAALTAALPARAQIVQTTSVPFLQIEPDSRTSGMGMAGVALADDANAIFWNPAGLAGQAGAEVTFTHAPWLPELGADLYFEYLAGKYAIPGVGTVAGHVTFLNLGEQQRVSEDGEDLGTFRSYDLAVGASYGRRIAPSVDVGVGLRFIYSNLAGGVIDAASTVVGDVGVLYRAPTFSGIRPTLGLTLANLGTSISYGDDGEPNAVPTYIRLGAALTHDFDEFNRLTFSTDFKRLLVDEDENGAPAPFYQGIFTAWGGRLVDPTPVESGTTCFVVDGNGDPILDGNGNRQDNPNSDCETVGALRQFTVGAGLEYWYNNLLALRTGYFYEDPLNGNRKFLTFGAGFRYSLVGIDLSYIYALEENSPLDQQIRFSVLLNVNR